MIMRKLLLALYALLSASFFVGAQTTKEEVLSDLNRTGSNYLAYPGVPGEATPSPKGYKPFYISHYGRHGSRYYISDYDIKKVYDIFDSASKSNALTQLGEDVKGRFWTLWQDIKDKASDLTPLGLEQHAGIAERMYSNYPEVFAKKSHVDARSTAKPRCILSMTSFLMRLKELQPELNVEFNASNAEARYLSPDDEARREARMKDPHWVKAFSDLHDKHVHPDRFVSALFSNGEYVSQHIDKLSLMRKVYDISSSLQGVTHLNVTLADLFTKEELFDNWLVQNAFWYSFAGPCPINGKDTPYEAVPLLAKIQADADKAIEGGRLQASLRFGHDIPLMGLLSLMRIDGCFTQETDLEKLHTKWCDFKIIPMASNIQMVFYKAKGDKPILVKFLLNEREVGIPLQSDNYPYYKWSDVSAYFSSLQNRK